MDIRWRTEMGSPRIIRVDCRVTPASVFSYHGGKWRRENPETRYHKYHETFDAAQRYLIGETSIKLKQIRAALAALERFEKQVLALEAKTCPRGMEKARATEVHGSDDVCFQTAGAGSDPDTTQKAGQ